MLVGVTSIGGQHDNNPAGIAEAFQYTTTVSGALTRLYVYIDASNAAMQVVVGLYTNTLGNTPGSLLTQGTLASPVKGAWNSVGVSAAAVAARTSYWIAVLSPVGVGTVHFRDVATGSRAQTSAQGNLMALPVTWSSGATYANSPLSAYASQN